jgi:hypothetical protein
MTSSAIEIIQRFLARPWMAPGTRALPSRISSMLPSISSRRRRATLYGGLLLSLSATCAAPLPVYGQADSDDPFSADPFSGAAPAAPAAAPRAAGPNARAGQGTPGRLSTDDPDPLVRLLRANPPQTPADVAEAIQWMTQASRWDEVRRYLDFAQGAGWSREQLAQFSRIGGAPLWNHIRTQRADINAAQQAFLGEILVLPSQLTHDPQWIDNWINRLASEPGDRRVAELRLHEASRFAVARLTQRLMAGEQAVPPERLVEALLQFRGDGVEALRAAAAHPDPRVAGHVLLAIASSSAREFAVELATSLVNPALPESTRQEIQNRLQARYTNLPSASAVQQYVSRHFKEQLKEYQDERQRRSRAPSSIWRLTADKQGVQVDEVTRADKALERLAQLAAARLRLKDASAEELTQAAVVLLQHSYQATRELEVADPLSGLLATLPDAAQPNDFWKQVFDLGSTWQMHGAALRAAQVIGQSLPGKRGTDDAYNIMAQLLRDARPALRFTAAQAIAQAEITEEFPGAATALETAIEMSRLGQGPMILVVGLTGELRQVAEQQIAANGGQSLAVGSTADALKVLDAPYPVEYILVVDRVPGNSVSALVSRLRNSRRGSPLPIGVLTDELTPVEIGQLERTPGVYLSVLTSEATNLARILNELDRFLDTRPLTSEERTLFAEAAGQLITQVSSDRERFAFYPLVKWESELINDRIGLPNATRMNVLAGLGTAQSQNLLLSIAADGAVSEAFRLRAADAFSASVSRFGLRLRRSDVLRAYDMYNDLGPHDPVAVQSLGKVLDAIEASAKPAVAAAP